MTTGKTTTPDWGKETTDVSTLELRHDMIECWPSFEAIRQYEWVRSEGKFNMITEFSAVVDEMYRLEFFDALEWLFLCKEHGIFFGILFGEAVDHYEKERPRKDWFDIEFRKGVQHARLSEKRAEIDKLQRELARLEKETDE